MRFDGDFAPNSYAWWYLDGLTADGSAGITIIAFIGSVFSPYYAWARRKQAANPLDFCALNVALYSRRGSRWSMSERGASQVERQSSHLRIAGSSMAFDGNALLIEVDEVAMPLPRRLVGKVRFVPDLVTHEAYALDPDGLHWWQPFAPLGRVEVDFSHPQVRWCGQGYVDCNRGAVPLEQSFASWQWSRISGKYQTTVLYDVNMRGAGAHQISLRLSPSRGSEQISRPTPVRLPNTRWGLPRTTRAADHVPRLIKTLEDAPFYSRSMLASPEAGGIRLGMHESLSLQRFEKTWVRLLLPFRMPRLAR